MPLLITWDFDMEQVTGLISHHVSLPCLFCYDASGVNPYIQAINADSFMAD